MGWLKECHHGRHIGSRERGRFLLFFSHRYSQLRVGCCGTDDTCTERPFFLVGHPRAVAALVCLELLAAQVELHSRRTQILRCERRRKKRNRIARRQLDDERLVGVCEVSADGVGAVGGVGGEGFGKQHFAVHERRAVAEHQLAEGLVGLADHCGARKDGARAMGVVGEPGVREWCAVC